MWVLLEVFQQKVNTIQHITFIQSLIVLIFFPTSFDPRTEQNIRGEKEKHFVIDNIYEGRCGIFIFPLLISSLSVIMSDCAKTAVNQTNVQTSSLTNQLLCETWQTWPRLILSHERPDSHLLAPPTSVQHLQHSPATTHSTQSTNSTHFTQIASIPNRTKRLINILHITWLYCYHQSQIDK